MSYEDTGAENKGATAQAQRGGQYQPRIKKLHRVLDGIDPETLPREGWTDELARRFEAYRDGRDGWDDGSAETEIDEWGGGGD